MVPKYLAALGLVGASITLAVPAMAQTAATAPAAKVYSTADTDIGTLLDNPQTKAVLDEAMPTFSSNPQVDMARSMTLRQIQSYSNGAITDDVLAKIDAKLAKIPAK